MRSVSANTRIKLVEILAGIAAVVLIWTLLIAGRSASIAGPRTSIAFGQGERAILRAITTDCDLSLESNLNSNRVEYHSRFFANRLPSGSIPIATFALPNLTDDSKNPPVRRTKSEAAATELDPVMVSYYRLNSKIFRLQNDPDMPATDPREAATLLADNVSDLELSQIISQTQDLAAATSVASKVARSFSHEPTSGATVLHLSDLNPR
jgi:hypothetical protein